MTRSTKRKTTKEIRKMIKKQSDERKLMKQRYEDEITALKVKLYNRENDINDILYLTRDTTDDSWAQAVYNGFMRH